MAALPKELQRIVGQARADVATLVLGLRGRHPSPLVDRSGVARRAEPASATRAAARTVRVAERVLETAESVSLVLEDPSGAPFHVVPGQFFTLLVDIDGRTHRRAYSASGDCSDRGRVRVTIKRVTGGLVSNHLADNVFAGAEIDVLGPSGNFVCHTDADAARHVVLVGGGSGVTPLMAIARAVLADEPGSRVSLVFGNRRIEDVIFLHDLESMGSAEGERFRISHVLEEPPESWEGGSGRLDRATVASELDLLAADSRPTTYYLCGPEPMMVAAREELLARGVPAAEIYEELFASPHRGPAARAVPTTPQAATVRVAGEAHSITVDPAQTVLEAGLQAGVPMKFSCAMGGCGACKVKLHAGEVVMDEPSCLTPSEREEGYVLACVSRACTPIDVEVE